MKNFYDKIIIGAGLYGLYAADVCSKNDEKILILEYDEEPFMRATYINQARVHMGYHYPRSYTTAIKSAGYYDLFLEDFDFSIKNDFEKIYAISKNFSWTDAKQFEKFCSDAKIPCKKIDTHEYFNTNTIDGSFITKECTYDAKMIGHHYIEKFKNNSKIDLIFNVRIKDIILKDNVYQIHTTDGNIFESSFVLNSTYASVNQILDKLNFEKIDIKYELCEIILCEVNDPYKNIGITVMDGPFFSLMPFGKTGLHSLTSVSLTPHKTSYEKLPTFDCQKMSENYCSPSQLGNCNTCKAKPNSAWSYMSGLAKKYLKEDIKIKYIESLYSIKPILKSSEVDDSRPTIIKKHSENPTLYSVLSGKINTIYDLNEILKNESQ